MPAANHTCGGYEDCLQESMCDGEHITCPVAAHKSNGTLCKGGTRVCGHMNSFKLQPKTVEESVLADMAIAKSLLIDVCIDFAES
ncbi:hypothetical protein EB796_021382 [Bugula neritina]|uniref:Uncharacterized protein n=1 Tax=Bugula neritina TaxID=10212 RepID=A0A7J7J2J9_BUGNE|nr:hypothetical protein EB796_021382 [Bugula neritina]